MYNNMQHLILNKTLEGQLDKKVGLEMLNYLKSSKDIAVVGMATEFPYADNVNEYWSNLLNGFDHVTTFPEERAKKVDIYRQITKDSHFAGDEKNPYVKGSYLKDVESFDYEFFKISKREAKLMDPHQRKLLESMYLALQDAGYPSKRLKGKKVGVFVGHANDFRIGYQDFIKELCPNEAALAMSGNLTSIIPSRLSYYLDLRGPSVLFNTACASFLTALHYACKSLNDDCEMAVVGSAKVNLFPNNTKFKLGMESSDGYARAFSNDSDGTGIGEGIGAVVLKPLQQALKDQDNIIAVIEESFLNQDGYTSGITVPNMQAQADLLYEAWKEAGIEPTDLSFIEAHGTGTKLGDPIEVEAITKAMQQFTNRKQFCAIESVKTNVGHLYEASGMASFIKSCLSVKNRTIPRNLHFKMPNEKINFENSPVYVVNQTTHVPYDGQPMRGAINSFGLSGTNCHVVLREYQEELVKEVNSDALHIFTLSAPTDEQLLNYLLAFTKQDLSHERIENICYTQCMRREHLEKRILILTKDVEDLINQLNEIVEASLEAVKEAQYINIEQANLADEVKEMLRSYLKGEDVVFEGLYEKQKVHVVSLPSIPLKRSVCWLDYDIRNIAGQSTPLHELVQYKEWETEDTYIYKTYLSCENIALLRDYKVMGINVLPETSYIEMVRYIFTMIDENQNIIIEDLKCIAPIRVLSDEERAIFIEVRKDNEISYHITIYSEHEESQVTHAECNVAFSSKDSLEVLKTLEIPEDVSYQDVSSIHKAQNIITFGQRWYMKVGINEGIDNVLLKTEFNKTYQKDFEQLGIHPALLDKIISTFNFKSQSDYLPYLPYSYKKIRIFNQLGPHTLTKAKITINEEGESICQDLFIFNQDGQLAMTIEGYIAKKITLLNPLNSPQPSAMTQYSWKKVEQIECTDIREDNVSKSIVIELFKHKEALKLDKFQELDFPTIRSKVSAWQLENENAIDTYCQQVLSESLTDDISFIVLDCRHEDDQMGNKIEENFNDSLDKLFILFKHLIKMINHKIKVVVIGEHIQSVLQDEEINHPLISACMILAEVLIAEQPLLSISTIDLDKTTDVYEALTYGFYAQENRIAFRNKDIYSDEYIEVKELTAIREKVLDLKEKTIVIAGGYGGIGLTLTRYFANKGIKNIIVFGRKSLEDIQKENPKRYEMIQDLRHEFEPKGVHFYNYALDICSKEALYEAKRDIEQQIGIVDGIVQCAGLPGRGAIVNKEVEEFRAVAIPKIIGTTYLDEVFGEKLSFMICMSSVASLTGMGGQADYSSANAFLNAFSYMNHPGNAKYLAVAWPSWSEIGMALDNDFVKDTFVKVISPTQAMALMDYTLSYMPKNVVLGEWNPSIMVNAYAGLVTNNAIKNYLDQLNMQYGTGNSLIQGTQQKHKCKLVGRESNVYTETEEIIAQVWANVLVCEEIDVEEEFNDMGGDSILATYLMEEIEKQYPGVFKMEDLFVYSSVAKMSGYYDSKQVH